LQQQFNLKYTFTTFMHIKQLLLLGFLLSASGTFAQSRHTNTVLSAVTDQPLSGVKFRVNGQFISQTDSSGIIRIDSLASGDRITLFVPDYEQRVLTLAEPRFPESGLYMYPDPEFEMRLRLEEDKKYGSLPNAALAPELETDAVFPGGNEAMAQFVKKHITYSEEMVRDGITGRVFVQFCVEPDGHVSHVQIPRKKHELLDREAVRIIRKMPLWEPGTAGGKPSRCFFILPINFVLE
jgi:TonB family protein